MSTILDALRKAKEAPRKDSVDARHEILSGDMHDYLATVPDNPEDQLRFMKRLMAVSAIAILLLTTAVAFLLLRGPRSAAPEDGTASASETVMAESSGTSPLPALSPAEASARAR